MWVLRFGAWLWEMRLYSAMPNYYFSYEFHKVNYSKSTDTVTSVSEQKLHRQPVHLLSY